ncbi:MarR family winged helix-turn-helix transcriptional regulator [Tanticharoenia sakaeratensis]|uniref:Transcriptional regulator, MarR family n=1 Tax=Tanticharoenia sakaeratensis NBRC 103193 TaxID=1231623 RepID=A0A0D6MPX5_9PROT|nr:MarR family transcriptional regulator [Tanticharoenia sakaeratensis]GAN55742.1 transcriptional regulator, MarR family [Tanticharoenia sakaeratensis NBRC 103193]GBQ18508.1 MarR family transcriptional regulator [Tanticharoenia sakaeratensis NBRC 103193]
MRADSSAEISRLRGQLTQVARRLRQEARNDPQSWTRMLVLSAIDRLGVGATPSAIGRAEDMRSPQVAAVLRDLENSGLVLRATDATDRRVTRLVLTGAGQMLLDESRRRRDMWLSRAMDARLSDDEREVVMRAGLLLERLADFRDDALC